MPSLLDRLRGVLKRASNSTSDLAAALDEARRAETEAGAAVERQAAKVAGNYLDDDKTRERDRVELERLRLAASDAGSIRAELERRHAASLDGEEQARRQAVYAAAKAKGDKAALDLAKAYPKLCQGIVGMLRDLAAAQIAVAEANEALPADAVPLPNPEIAARGVFGLPREIVSEEIVELWSRVDMTTPVDAEYQDRVYSVDNHGKPSGWGRRPSDLEPCFRLRRFNKVTYRERTDGDFPTPLAASIRLPAARGSGMIWGNQHLMHDPAVAASMGGEAEPQRVLANADEADAAASVRSTKVERSLKVEFTLLGDVVPLPVEKPVPDTMHRPIRTAAPVRHGSSPFSLPARAGGRR